jgi:hypothetical protein
MSRRRRGADHALDDTRVQDILSDAEVVHSCVRAKRGPHLTPTAVSWEADRLWAVAPRDSVKVRALRRDDRIGLLVSIDGHHLVGTGTVRLMDPLDFPVTRGVGDLLRAPFGAVRYLTENTRHALNVVLDDPNPLDLVDRALLSITLRRVALVHRDRVVDAWGDWPATDLLDSEPLPADDFRLPAKTPVWARKLIDRDGEVQVGWRSTDGPLALPATWSAETHTAAVSAELLALAGALPQGEACVTRSTLGYRMSEKTGVLLRGAGHAALGPDGTASLSISPGRVTHWRGKDARTHSMSGART